MSAKGKRVIEETDLPDNVVDDANLSGNSSGTMKYQLTEDNVASTKASPSAGSEQDVQADVVDHGVDLDVVKCMTFESWEEAEEFYSSYSKRMGFGVRRRDCRKSAKGKVLMYKWVCSREGVRHPSNVNRVARIRPQRAETRERCGAMFQVNFNCLAGNFFVRHFIPKHNHNLVPKHQVHYIPSHWCVRDIDGMDVNALRRVGVKTSQVFEYIALQSGGYQNVGFTRKDMYNHVEKQLSLLVHNGDARSTLGYFAGLKRGDPSFYFDHSLDGDQHLCRLFWSDSTCQLDYRFFGDAIAFDATYKRNVYHFPLVMIIGMNHHHQSIIFGCGLLECETIEAYTWLLNTFIKCMCMKTPVSVITDGDKAMRAAITVTMPQAKHHLCAWHLERNAMCEVKDPHFLVDFKRFLMDCWEIEDFERRWIVLIDKYKLHNNAWASRMYESRRTWAETYLKGYFFGGLRSTSRCEAMHSFINHFVNRKLKLLEFVDRFEGALNRIRNAENEADHKSMHSHPVCVHALRNYELKVAEMYTAASFQIFQRELYKESAYVLSGSVLIEGDSEIYNICKWSCKACLTKVIFNRETLDMKCPCLMMESCGFPCRHLLAVCKLAGLIGIPDYFIWVRWSKKAKSSGDLHIDRPGLTDQTVKMVRCGALTTKCRSIIELASRSDAGFQLLNKYIHCIKDELQQMQGDSANNLCDHPYAVVRDPIVPKKQTRNTQDKRKSSDRRCGNCREVGHIRTKCPHIHVDVQSNIQTSPVQYESPILGDVVLGDGIESDKLDVHPLTGSQPIQWETHESLSDDSTQVIAGCYPSIWNSEL